MELVARAGKRAISSGGGALYVRDRHRMASSGRQGSIRCAARFRYCGGGIARPRWFSSSCSIVRTRCRRFDAWGTAGDALPLMKAVKNQLDPKNTLNPLAALWVASDGKTLTRKTRNGAQRFSTGHHTPFKRDHRKSASHCGFLFARVSHICIVGARKWIRRAAASTS